MAEYIEREETIIHLEKLFLLQAETAAKIINAIPTADVVHRAHGRWIKRENEPLLKCSICGICGFEGFYYCPNCGAKMDEVDE